MLTETVTRTSGLALSSMVNTGHNAVLSEDPLELSPGNSQGHAVEDLRPGQVMDAVRETEAGAELKMICNPSVAVINLPTSWVHLRALISFLKQLASVLKRLALMLKLQQRLLDQVCHSNQGEVF